MPNKVRFGLTNMYYAMQNADGTFAKPVRIPGAESVDVKPADGETANIYADNKVYHAVSAGGGTWELDVQVARLPKSFLVDALGYVETKGGALAVGPDSKQRNFACLFQTDGDVGGIRMCFYSCVSSMTSDSFKTNTDSPQEAPQTAKFTANPCTLPNGSQFTKSMCETGDAEYDGWFDEVFTDISPKGQDEPPASE